LIYRPGLYELEREIHYINDMHIQRFELQVPGELRIRGLTPSFGSGLAFHRPLPDGGLEFFALSDRGPNGDGPMAPHPSGGLAESKIFPAPEFVPTVATVRIDAAGAYVTHAMPLRFSARDFASGLPRPPGLPGHSGEVPLNEVLRPGHYHQHGIDPEGIAYDAQRQCLWIADDYGPFLMRVDMASGMITHIYGPGAGLPAAFSRRAPNRGVEGLTLDPATGMLYVAMQSPLLDANGAPDGHCLDYACFNPDSESTLAVHAYPLDAQQYKRGRTREAKLGDFAALGNGRFVVIEQGKGADGKVFHYLVLSATDGSKQQLLDLDACGWTAEKAEGLCLVDPHTLAISSDNDFGLRTALFGAHGEELKGFDVTDCEVDAAGRFVGAAADRIAVARIVPAAQADRHVEIWLLRFDQPLT
jgi:hypothetical protein